MKQGAMDADAARADPPGSPQPPSSALVRLWTASGRMSPLHVGLVATLALTLLQWAIRNTGAPQGDEQIYERMADHPFATHTFPFGYRVGVPWLVHVLPGPNDLVFTVVALLSAGAAAGFLYALMCELETPPRVAAALAVLFAVSPIVLVALLRNARNVDPTTLLVMCAASWWIVRRNVPALALTLLLGAFVRESAMFLVPFAYAVWAERWIDWGAARRTLLAALPAVVVYLLLRLEVDTVGRELVVGYGQSFLDGRETVLRTGFDDPVTALRRVFIAFGPLWLVAPFALPRMRYAQRGLVLFGCCLASIAFALDWGRVLVLAAPVIYPAAGWVLARHPRLRAPVVLLWLLVVVVYAVYMQVHGVESGLVGAGRPSYPIR